MSNFNEWVGNYFGGKDSLRTFKVGDRRASIDEQNVMESENYVMARNKEVYEEDFDTWMQSVDWSAVDNMIQEMVNKSGVQDKAINNIWPGRIVNEKEDPNSLGEFEMNGNYIGLNNDLLNTVAKDAKVDIDILRTQVLLHEVAHAASKHENQVSYKSFKTMFEIFKETFLKEFSFFGKPSTETLTSAGNYYVNKRSIHRDKLDRKVGEEEFDFFGFLDDSIVEKMSADMLLEYNKRTGKFSQEALNDFYDNYLKNEQVNPGAIYVIFIDAIVKILADYNKMDKQVVWQAFVRGQFNEKPLEDSEVKEMFDKAFYLGFLDDLGRVSTNEEFSNLIPPRNSPGVSPGIESTRWPRSLLYYPKECICNIPNKAIV
ncbi:MAG: hypothetical protein WCT11_04900, partial [Candidatus Magasanikbacteria bacterium]